MRPNKNLLFATFMIFSLSIRAQVYLTEGFEAGSKPDGWTEQYVAGSEPWRYRNGGHSPNDNNWLVPPDQVDITRNPPAAYSGTYNAIFFKQGDNNERTKLITPELNLLGGTMVELSFYLCQIPWTFEGSTGWDVLRIYYKVSSGAPWVLLREFLDPVYDWELQTLVLPNLSSTYSVAFEGHTRWGYGTCIDNITIEEKGSQQLWIADLQFKQPFTDFVPSGSVNVPVMRVDFKVFGNTGSAKLDYISFTSLNTSDADILPNGVKLYSTLSQTFSRSNPVGSPTSFVSGVASFTGLNYNLPTGMSYLWLALDVQHDAAHGNILDIMVAANAMLANDTLYPAANVSPFGDRMIYETHYFENFEGIHNWTLTGEFQVATPNGMGGTPGNPNPGAASSGTKALGTDLTGLGANPYNYEPDIGTLNSYTATSPTIDVFYYKNLNLFFQRYLNIEVWDNSSIQVSTNNGTTWHNLWESNSYLSDYQWSQYQYAIPNEYSRTQQFKLRFKLGPTDAQNNYSGWNIDDIFLTGEFISKDVGVSEWIYPQSGSGHSASDSVRVRITNYGGADITSPVPVAYSFNGGTSWVTDDMTQTIPVGGSVIFTFPTRVDLSVPGYRPSVLAKTMLPGDQYPENDQLSTDIYIVPTYTPPYLENFETNDGYWRATGNDIWEYGTPTGSVINTASSGTENWMTGLSQKYGSLIAQVSQVIFEDNFEIGRGWTFSGEFERAVPSNMFLPYFAYSGTYCIGTDLTGRGTYPYSYENGISPGTAYTATSPAFDVSDYSNLYISYQSWITIQEGDSAKLEVSPDNGTKWYTLWKNSEGEIMDVDFQYHQIAVPDSLSYSTAMRFRFSLFYTSAAGPVAEGIFVDDFVLTGDLINDEPGYLNSPGYDLTGMSHPVLEARMWVETEQDVDGATLYYSLDDGNSWTPVTNSSGFDTYWNWYTGKPVSALGLNGWSGHSGGWITVRHLLPTAVLNQGNVQFRFKFAADKIDNNYDGIAVDDIQVYQVPQDIGVMSVLSPVSACELSPGQTFSLRLRNHGVRDLLPGDSIKIGYRIERSGDIQTATETVYLSQSFAAGINKDFNLASPFDLSVSGEYQVDVFTIEPDPFFFTSVANDTVSQIIRVNKPVVDLGPDISTVRPDTLVLNAFSGVTGYSYLWQDSSTDSVFHVSTQGTYYVTVTNDLSCSESDTVHVLQLIADLGVSQIVGPLSACELENQLPIQIRIHNFGTDTVDVLDTIFVSGSINEAVFFHDTLYPASNFYPGETIDYTYLDEFDFSTPGTYLLKLYTRLRDDFTNTNDTLEYALEVYGYPVVDLGRDTVVHAAQYLLQAPPGYHGYLWQDNSTQETFLVDQPGQDWYHVMVSNIHGCFTTDSVHVTLNVKDISLDRILSPETSCGLSENITVSARITNSGNLIISAGETVNMAYRIDTDDPVQDAIILAQDFLPGASIDHVFPGTATVMTGQWYDFTVYVSYTGDVKSWNDTIMMPVGVFATPVVDLGPDQQVVVALEYVLDAGPGFVAYEWQDGSTGQTLTVNTPGIGVYGVTVTDINGCTAYDEVEIMLAVPDIGVLEVSHPQTACSLGTQEHVQVAVKNFGTWNIDQSATISVSYSINGAAAVTENIPLAGTFDGNTVIYHTFSVSEDFSAPDIYEITAFTMYGSDLVPGNDTLVNAVEVYGMPVVNIGGGQDTLLVYDPVTLDATPGYASYLWQDGSTGSSYLISDPGAGMYSVLVTSIHGCQTHDSVYVVHDVPDLAINRVVTPLSACTLGSDETVSIEIMNNGYYRIATDEPIGISYTVDNGLPVSEVIYLSHSLQPGSSTVISFSGRYDFSATDTFQLFVLVDYPPDEQVANNQLNSEIQVWGYPNVEIGGGQDTVYTSYTTLPLTLDAGPGHASCLWQDNSTGMTLQASQFGLYWVMVTSVNGCSGRDSVYILSPLPVEDPPVFPGQIRIYPNPADDMLNVVVETDTDRALSVELFTMLNTLVFREDFKPKSLLQTGIAVDGLAPGTYLLRITAGKIPHTMLVVVR